MEKKHFNAKQIGDEFAALSCTEKLQILYDALDIMQQYNGRTKFLCIAIAMGYDSLEEGNDTFNKRTIKKK